MKRLSVCLVLLLSGAVVAFAPAALAELSAGQKLAAEALIRDFSAKEFTTRQQAVEKLIALGPDVIPLIRKTLAETRDAEVKLRCEMTLKGIAQKFGVGAVAEKTPAATDTKTPLNLDASKVTLDVKDAPLDEVMQKLAQASGNQPIDVPENLRDKTVTLSVKEMPYWQAVDKVCELAGVLYMYMADGVQGKLRLAEAGEMVKVGFYAGPVVVKVDQVAATRSFRRVKMPAGAPDFGRSYLAYQLSYFREDRLQNVAMEVQLTKVLTPDGKNLVSPYRLSYGGGQRMLTCGFVPLIIPEVPEGLERLAEISGVLQLECGIGEKVLRVEDVLGGEREPAAEDGVTITVKKAERQGNLVSADVEAKREGRQGLASFAPENTQCGFFLVDPKGVRHRAFVREASYRPLAGAAPGPADMVPGEAQLKLIFNNVPDIEGPWTLLFAYPERTESREFPFTIKDVPVP